MRNNCKRFRIQRERSKGFSVVELVVAIAISLVIAAFAIPGFQATVRSLRISGDGRDLNGAINGAKMQAASDFTHARIFADLAANTFHIEIWNKALNGGAGCWQTVRDLDAGGNARCTIIGTSPTQALSQGVTFGLGGIATPPPNTQAAIKEGVVNVAGCDNILGGGGTMPLTACIVFNSRGIPIVANTPNGNGALYVTDRSMVYGVTVNTSGSIQVWFTPANTGAGNGLAWQHR